MIKDTIFTTNNDSDSDVSMDVDSSENEEEESDSEQSEINEDEEKPNEQEEDDLVKAINASKELHREHPPAISIDDYVGGLCFHPINDLIAVGNLYGDVLLYKYNNEETNLVSTIELHEKACRDLKFSNDGEVLYSVSKDKSIMITDVQTEKLKASYDAAHDVPIYTITVLSEDTFATGDEDGTVKLWDLRQKSQTCEFSLKKMNDYVSTMITNDEKKYLVCGSGDGSITTINIPARKLHCQSEEYDEEFTSLGLFKNDTKILASTSKGKMYLFNWGEFGYHSDEFPNLTKKAINCMIPITDNIVITGGEDGNLRAYSLFPHRRLGIVGQHNFPIESIDVSNNGALIATSSHDNLIKFWNVQYFETMNLQEQIKGGKQVQMKYNLPSSKINNPSDFFKDL
ncbi:hypothetical protein PV327_010741 [Microctonus hyperodae]|uniref:WD repeat-containing protein 55 homolog n=1 Tax=Microctonus hyperodae TaxID=165561 RepID=A0AA39EY01_MICHY|nr:hypothetical protein PV327_010741 [Microctonus hyperodae]